MSEEIKKYDKNSNLIYYKYSNGLEYWYKYDENNNLIYYFRSDGFEYWCKHDKNNNEIYWKNSSGYEHWYKYDENDVQIEITKQEYKDIEFREQEKEYNSRTKCSRFELMEI